MIWLLDCSIISTPNAQSLSLPEIQLTLPPSIKAKLRSKNHMMRAGRIEKANALAVQISKEIT